MKLKRGDKVLVQKPENIHEPPVWVFAMDKFDGKIMTVSSAGEDRVRLEGLAVMHSILNGLFLLTHQSM